MPAARQALLLAALALLQLAQAAAQAPGAEEPPAFLEPRLLLDYGRVAVFSLNVSVRGEGLRVASHPTSPLIAVHAGRDLLVISPWWAASLPVSGLAYEAVWGPYLAVYDPQAGRVTLYLATPEGLEAVAQARLVVAGVVAGASFTLVGRLACLAAANAVAYVPLDSPEGWVVREWPGTPRLASCTPLEEWGWGYASPWEPLAAAFSLAPGGLALALEGPGTSTAVEVYSGAGVDSIAAAAFPRPGAVAAAVIPRAGQSVTVLVTLANYSISYSSGLPVVAVEYKLTETLWHLAPEGSVFAAGLALAPGRDGSAALAAALAYFTSSGGVNVSIHAARLALNASGAFNESYSWTQAVAEPGPVRPPLPPVLAAGRVELAVLEAGGVYVLAWADFRATPLLSGGGAVLASPEGGAVKLPPPLPGGPPPDYARAGSGRGIAALALAYRDQGRVVVYYMVDRPAAAEAAGLGAPEHPALTPVASIVSGSRLLALYQAPSLGVYVLLNVSEGFPALETPWGPMPLPLAQPRPGEVYRLTLYSSEGGVELPLPAGCRVGAAGSVTSPPPLPGSTALEPLEALEAAGSAAFEGVGPTATVYALLDCGEAQALAVVRVRAAEPYRAQGYLAALPGGGVALVVVGLEGSPPPGAALAVAGPWGHATLALPQAGRAASALLPGCGPCYISIPAYGYVAAATPPSTVIIELPGGVTATPDQHAGVSASEDGVAVVAGRYPLPLPSPAPTIEKTAAPEPTPPPTTQQRSPLDPRIAVGLAVAAAAGAAVGGLACAPRRHGRGGKHK